MNSRATADSSQAAPDAAAPADVGGVNSAAPAAGPRYMSDAILFFLASGAISALNYVFVLLAMLSLSNADFGTFNSLLACITISTVVVNSFQLHVTHCIARLRHAGGDADAYVRSVTRSMIRLCGAGLLAAAVSIPLARWALAATWNEWLLTYATIAAFFFSTFANGISSGLLRLRVQSIANLAGTLLKLGLGAVLLWCGLGISGALAASLAGLASIYLITLPALRKTMTERITPTTDRGGGSAANAFRLPFIAAYLCVVGPFSLDQILVQALARPLSGDYGAVCTLGKIVFLAVGPILWVQYSHIAAAQDDPARQLRVFLRGLRVSTFLAALLAAGLWIATAPLAGLILPPRYGAAAPWIGPMAAGVVLYVVGHAIALLLLARRQTAPLFVVGGALVLQTALVLLHADSLGALVANQMIVYAAQLVLICAAAYSTHFPSRPRATAAEPHA